MSYKEIKLMLEELESLYNILDLMNNGIISKFYKKKLTKEIDFILEALKKCNK